MQYFTSKVLFKHTVGLEPPTPGTSLAVLNGMKTHIQQNLKSNHKRAIVDKIFVGVSGFLEMLLHDGAKIEDASGLAQFITEEKGELFNDDLEEVSFDIPDRMVPDAKLRVLLSMAIVTQEFIKLKKLSNDDENAQ